MHAFDYDSMHVLHVVALECEFFNKCRKLQQAGACGAAPGCEWNMAKNYCRYTESAMEFPDRAPGTPNCLLLGEGDCTASNTNTGASLSPLQDCMWTDEAVKTCRAWSRCYDLGQ